MPDQHEINSAHEARIAELEQQLAALQDRRPAARSRLSRRGVAAFGVMLALLAVPGVVFANHQFSDVPDGGFHDDIEWLADYGITTGYDDRTFRPGNAVTRQAMAAFMHRLSNEFEVVSQSFDPPAFNGTVNTSAGCPDDKRAIAGGGYHDTLDLYMVRSFPDNTGSWSVAWEPDNNMTVDPGIVTVYALCAPRL